MSPNSKKLEGQLLHVALFLKQELKATLMGVSKVRRTVSDKISLDSILFDPSVAKICHFKHDVGASNVINFNNFIGNPVVNKH